MLATGSMCGEYGFHRFHSFHFHSFIDHGDGLVSLRVHEPLAIDSGIYTCVVTSEYGCCTTSNEVTIVEDSNCVREIVPEFIKELVPAVAMHGSLVSFCARVTPVTSKVKWFICGREINENTRGITVSHCLLFSFFWTNLAQITNPIRYVDRRTEFVTF